MGAALSQTRTIYTSPGRVVQCSYDKAITTLHDPLTLIKMDPLAVSHQQSATDPDLWTIRDQLIVLGFKFFFSSRGRHTKYEDGVSFDVNAPLGIVMKDRWTISKADGGINLEQRVDTTVRIDVNPLREAGDIRERYRHALRVMYPSTQSR